MWHTPDGDRELRGADARLVKSAITGVVEWIKEEAAVGLDQMRYGIPLFDELPWQRRLLLLERVRGL